MLVTLKEILSIADERRMAIGSFNTPNMTTVESVISAAEQLKQPVILMHAQVHEEMGLCKMEDITLTRPLSSRHFLWTPVMRYKHNGLPLGFVLS